MGKSISELFEELKALCAPLAEVEDYMTLCIEKVLLYVIADL